MGQPAAAPCELLAWDTEHWGFRVARVTAPALTLDDADRVDAWCRQHDVACLAYLAPFDQPATTQAAERLGFSLVDIRLTLTARPAGQPAPPIADVPAAPHVRLHQPADIPGLERIAAANHQDSRFYFDGRFPRAGCDALYATWIRRSCEGWADAVLVPEVDGEARGYITCHLDAAPEPGGPPRGRIGLVGVGEQARGRGIGPRLVYASLDWFREHEAETVSVVTQGRNVQAQRLYQRCGFVTASVALWYHRWFDAGVTRG